VATDPIVPFPLTVGRVVCSRQLGYYARTHARSETTTLIVA